MGVTARQRLVYEDGWVVGTEESVVSVSTSSVGRLLTVSVTPNTRRTQQNAQQQQELPTQTIQQTVSKVVSQ